VVIALASRNLPPKQQKKAILFGSAGAIVLRIVLTFFAAMLLDVPYLKIIGAVLLLWIGAKMLVEDDGDENLEASDQLFAAIKTIILADLVMSLDNVIGVAAAAKGHTGLLIAGLAISIPLIIFGSQIVLKIMERFPVVIIAGAALLGWVAGEMAVEDVAIKSWAEAMIPFAHKLVPTVGAVLVVVAGKWMARRAAARAPVHDLAAGKPFPANHP
jgi:YjbE family integral membrane protein